LEDEGDKILPAPRPIPGGDVIPPQIHVFEPGTPNKVLPYTGAPMEGLDVEPSTITDFKGFIAQAYHVGTATGSDGKRYSLETDIRAYQGDYVAADGSHHSGTFALLWIDLFVPGTGTPATQVHDNNGGIPPSGLFWTVQLPNNAFRVLEDGKGAQLNAKQVPLIDQFVFQGPNAIPSTVSLDVRWQATGPRVKRGSGKAVKPTDAAAFLGEFAIARSTASFSGAELGFQFKSDPGASSDPKGFAELGSERNGTFL
jgi:hypothetical protein